MSLTRLDDPFNSTRTLIFAVAALLFAAVTILGYWQEPKRDPFAPVPSWNTWERWLEPSEENAFRRLVNIGKVSLNSIRFLEDGQRGWAAGKDGTLLGTADGGKTWIHQSSWAQAGFRSVYFLGDGQHGWVADADSTLLATTDGGKTWSSQISGTKAQLNSVYFLDSQRGWVAGGDGILLATTDGGKIWSLQSSGTQAWLNSVYFLGDGLRGWAAGNNGTLLSTVDGGQSWTPQSSGTKFSLESVRFLGDGQRGWVEGGGTLLSTADGGKTWSPQSSGSQARFSSVYFLADGQRGWATDIVGTLLSTVDGGNTWVPQSSGTQAWLYSVYFLEDGQRGWAAGENGTLLATADGGKTWTPQSSGEKTGFYSVDSLRDGQHGWVAGSDGTLLSTTDGGETWTPQSSGTKALFFSLSFLEDGQHGWAASFDGILLSTADGGKTWISQSSGTKAGFMSLYFLGDGQRGWVAGGDGALLATTDGGKTWMSQSSGTQARLNSVYFLEDGQRGWVVGNGGTLLATADGGKTWTPQISGTEAAFISLYFLGDGQRGWVVGNGGTLLATADGGKTWTPQISGTGAGLGRIYFLGDGQRGWVVGNGGTLLTTADGGKTWEPQVVGTNINLTSFKFSSDGNNGIAVGNGGIFFTHNGGKTWNMPRYQRSLAPWVYAAWGMIFLLTWLALRIERRIQSESAVADVLVSDEPVETAEADVLGYRELVNALGAFLRNRRTVPPLTIAVTAPWGKGKSSVMRQLFHDMKRRGACPVWFNAWHYQKEEIILAAMLENIRAQAIPFFLRSWGWGLWFRMVLLLRRMEKHFWVTTLVMVLLLFGVDVLDRHGNGAWDALRLVPWQPLIQLEWTKFVEGIYAVSGKNQQLLQVLMAVAAIAGAVAITLLYGLRAFPEHPAVLLANLSDKFKRGEAEAKTSFRHKFSRHFGDVCLALQPRILTVFIDDLDRCAPEKALEVLEAVNYLTTSGRCYVVLGMAREVVESLVGLASERLAKEMVLETAVPNGEDDGNNATAAQGTENEIKKRRDYARRYLEKLINIEVPVPSAWPDTYRKLAAQRREWKLVKWYDDCGSAKMLASLLLASVIAVIASHWFLQWKSGKDEVVAPVAQTVSENPAAKTTKTQAQDGMEQNNSSSVLEYGRGTFVPADPINDYPAIIGFVAFGFLFMLFFLRWTRGRFEVDDSPAFRKALSIWLPLVVAKQDSPRWVKRFINHARFLAMRSRGAELSVGMRERLIFLEEYVKGWLRMRTWKKGRKIWHFSRKRWEALKRLWLVRDSGVPAEMLVALLAIHYAVPEEIRSENEIGDQPSFHWNADLDPASLNAAEKEYVSSFRKHSSTFSAWPPSKEQLEKFKNWLALIRQAT